MSNLIKKKLMIEGMHCSSCAMNIDFDLEDLSGLKVAKTNYARQETEVEFEQEKLDIAKIIAQIKKTGYIAKEKSG